MKNGSTPTPLTDAESADCDETLPFTLRAQDRGKSLYGQIVRRSFAADFERRLAAAERAFRRIEQALLPDPNDERDISVDWLRKEIHAAIDAARSASTDGSAAIQKGE